ncbi:MAG: response regulator [Pseudorhodoplanes sp.]|jgi:two-component system response regulator FixJ|nr:response regulator [Pseudorhodoplanes sp.]
MTIALIEDDEAILRSLSQLLETRGMTVRCFATAESFLGSFGTDPLDCVISDIRMPGMSGLELQRELRERDAAVPIILITGHGDIAMAVSAIKGGAFDFIEKPFDAERLVESIGLAVERGMRARIEHNERVRLQQQMSELSPRQLEVMWLVAEGLSNKEIALKLRISPRTVENYRAWVMEKMGAKNLADLVRKVMALG